MGPLWTSQSEQVTQEEADKLVDLWLRRRLNPTPLEPSIENGLHLADVARALGTSEAELSALLHQMRTAPAAKGSKRAIPISRSWLIIAAIYGVFGLSLATIGLIQMHSRRPVVYSVMADQWHQPHMISQVDENGIEQSSLSTPIPFDVGFRYRSEYTPSLPQATSSVDWKAAEKSILESVKQIDKSQPPRLIERQGSAGPRVFGTFGEPTPVEASEVKLLTMPTATWSEEVIWHRLEVEVNGSKASVLLPAPPRDIDAASRGEIERESRARIDSLFKSLKSKDAVVDDDLPRL